MSLSDGFRFQQRGDPEEWERLINAGQRSVWRQRLPGVRFHCSSLCQEPHWQIHYMRICNNLVNRSSDNFRWGNKKDDMTNFFWQSLATTWRSSPKESNPRSLVTVCSDTKKYVCDISARRDKVIHATLFPIRDSTHIEIDGMGPLDTETDPDNTSCPFACVREKMKKKKNRIVCLFW